ncbi:MAG: hypothetical protein WC901_01740 [Candidatus Margulisiibacteriota bacterium]
MSVCTPSLRSPASPRSHPESATSRLESSLIRHSLTARQRRSQSRQADQQQAAALDTLFKRPIPDYRILLHNTRFANMQLVDTMDEGSTTVTFGHLIRAYQRATNGFLQIGSEFIPVGLANVVSGAGLVCLYRWTSDAAETPDPILAAAGFTALVVGIATGIWAHLRINQEIDSDFARILQRVNYAAQDSHAGDNPVQASALLAALPRNRVRPALQALGKQMGEPDLAKTLWAGWQRAQ